MNYVNPKRQDIRSISVEEEVMLHDSATKQVYVLNPTAALIWSLCDGKHTVDQIVTIISNKFGNSIPISQNVHQTVAKFREYGLLNNVYKSMEVYFK